MLVVFDLDGTLSILGDRVNHLKETPPNWDRFYDRCDEDTVNEPIAHLFDLYRDNGDDIRIVTGRVERVRQKTLDWLKKNELDVMSSELFMRPDGDFRPDTELKLDLCKDFLGHIYLVFEDRASVVKMWRENGVKCCQVAEGDF